MKHLSFLLGVFVFASVSVCFTSGRSNGTPEHEIRKMLLDDYDKMVFPPPAPNTPVVVVEFGLQIARLVELNNKEEVITVDTWVVMKWNNSFFKWQPKDFDKLDKVHFQPSEVWFPDIVLYNNGDSSTPRAGGRSKFLSNVAVESSGLNVWSGPATFTANCKLALKTWPFDNQTCELKFGSYSYGSNRLKLTAFETASPKSDNFLQNANWEMESKLSTQVGETDFGNCCPYNFSEIKYVIKMERRFQYHLFYLVAPCLVLSLLTLMSFWIPSESGERIGFVTTLLLGMTVFLLVIPSSLPESSESIPVLGITMMGTMVIITFVLLATILVLRFFHSTGRPPKYLRRIFKSTHKLEPQPVHVLEASDKADKNEVNLKALHLQEHAPTEAAPVKPLQEDNEITWQMVATKLDKFFFWVFLISIVIMYSVLLTLR